MEKNMKLKINIKVFFILLQFINTCKSLEQNQYLTDYDFQFESNKNLPNCCTEGNYNLKTESCIDSDWDLRDLSYIKKDCKKLLNIAQLQVSVEDIE